MRKSVSAFRENGRYLPPALRDFHDQKDVFRLIHRITKVEGNEYCKDVTWVAGQCYVIDIFLWTMARFGYTLQRSRANVDFADMQEFIKAHKAQETETLKQIFQSREPTTQPREMNK